MLGLVDSTHAARGDATHDAIGNEISPVRLFAAVLRPGDAERHEMSHD
jgi:hypothetical protein